MTQYQLQFTGSSFGIASPARIEADNSDTMDKVT